MTDDRRPKTLEDVVRWWLADQTEKKAEAPDEESRAYHEGFIDALRVVAVAAEIELA